MAPASVTATTAPWNWSQKLRNHPAHGCAARASFHANQNSVAPMNVFWTTALSFPAPIAGITTPLREESERSNEELASHQQQGHPHGKAAPPGDAVVDQNRGVPCEPENRDE